MYVADFQLSNTTETHCHMLFLVCHAYVCGVRVHVVLHAFGARPICMRACVALAYACMYGCVCVCMAAAYEETSDV